LKKIVLTLSLLLPNTILTAETPKLPKYKELVCMAANAYREARGEPPEGQVAVTRVVLNRMKMKEYPKTACGVIYQKHQFSWTSKYKSVVYTMNDINTVVKAYNSEEEFPATHYHSKAVHPSWRKGLKEGVTIGNHIFYWSK